ncbi:kinase [Alkalimonas amylolytica]|uniref:D-glycerate 3-kinase n=1 Tax=Alkalimonas amylolytica TaxID=152573 RepID=A0A1H4DGW0_ALKAM|nr:kinase [Alkalimonas amylolytica]SEA71788.1 D-glycerate 3-kinase [Alkalimonas amylolytica]
MQRTEASPVYQQLLDTLCNHLLALPKPAVVGISGAQGTGKSTLARLLTEQLRALGLATTTVSLDDYYLSKAMRLQLAEQVHPLLAQRGVPGTHAINRAIDDAKNVLAAKPVQLPCFDKALDEPVRDRPPQQLQLLIVEGWCLGLGPQSEQELHLAQNSLEANDDPTGQWRYFINQQLAGPYQQYWQLLKPLIWLQAPDWASVCRWRAKQEQQLWQQSGRGMTRQQLERFMLSFERLTRASWQQLPQRTDVLIPLDHHQQPRLPASLQRKNSTDR